MAVRVPFNSYLMHEHDTMHRQHTCISTISTQLCLLLLQWGAFLLFLFLSLFISSLFYSLSNYDGGDDHAQVAKISFSLLEKTWLLVTLFLLLFSFRSSFFSLSSPLSPLQAKATMVATPLEQGAGGGGEFYQLRDRGWVQINIDYMEGQVQFRANLTHCHP